MTDTVQCDRCERKHDPNEFITRVTLVGRRAAGGVFRNPLQYDFCAGCLEDVRLRLVGEEFPEVEGLE